MGSLVAVPTCERSHPWLEASLGPLWALLAGTFSDCRTENGVFSAPWPAKRRGGQQREAWTEEELRGAGESGPGRSVSPSSPPRAAADRPREPGAYGSHPRPQSTPTCASGGQATAGTPRFPRVTKDSWSLRVSRARWAGCALCPAGLERAPAPGGARAGGGPGRRRVAGKGGASGAAN